MNRRRWLPPEVARRIEEIRDSTAGRDPAELAARIEELTSSDRRRRSLELVNLDPAANLMSSRAEALMASGMSGRPSLGYPGAKYETGLADIEAIEVITAELATGVFGADFVEVRLLSGAMANLAGFLATCAPGDAVVVPPATLGGHVTHHRDGVAGLLGLEIHPAPVAASDHAIDLDGLDGLCAQVKPALITAGTSLNLRPPAVSEMAEIAHRHGARLMVDAAHFCGLVAGGLWPRPLDQGADLMTMSTYKSLAGPPGGLLVTNDPALAERVEAITHPGLTANFDAGRVAALGITLAEWARQGPSLAQEMVSVAAGLARRLVERGLPVATTAEGPTRSHQLALDARAHGGGGALARRLALANVLTCPIGLPTGLDAGLRLGTPEVASWGLTEHEVIELADLVAEAVVGDPEAVRVAVAAFRRRFPERANRWAGDAEG